MRCPAVQSSPPSTLPTAPGPMMPISVARDGMTRQCRPSKVDCKARPVTAILIAVLLTLVAALENTVAPWAPFYIAYAVLASGLPFLIGAVDRGMFRRPSLRSMLVGRAMAFLLQ